MLLTGLSFIPTAYNERYEFLIRWGKCLKAANYPGPLRQGKHQIIQNFQWLGVLKSCL